MKNIVTLVPLSEFDTLQISQKGKVEKHKTKIIIDNKVMIDKIIALLHQPKKTYFGKIPINFLLEFEGNNKKVTFFVFKDLAAYHQQTFEYDFDIEEKISEIISKAD